MNMELDAKVVLEVAFRKINELERELVCEKAINQQLLQKVEELEGIIKQFNKEENNE